MGRILTVVVNRPVDLGSQRELSGLVLISDLTRDSVGVVLDATQNLMGRLIRLTHGVL